MPVPAAVWLFMNAVKTEKGDGMMGEYEGLDESIEGALQIRIAELEADVERLRKENKELSTNMEIMYATAIEDGQKEGMERAAEIAETNLMAFGSIGQLHKAGWDQSCKAAAQAIRDEIKETNDD